jgi:nitrate/nitrite transporter NarK
LLCTLLLAIGLASGVVVVGFAFAKESAPARLAGTAGGIANMGNMFGGLVMQPVIGLLLDHAWQGAMQDGVRRYDSAAWQIGFSLMLVWIVLGSLLMCAARETHCRPMVE